MVNEHLWYHVNTTHLPWLFPTPDVTDNPTEQCSCYISTSQSSWRAHHEQRVEISAIQWTAAAVGNICWTRMEPVLASTAKYLSVFYSSRVLFHN
jgi:hypothetical protein